MLTLCRTLMRLVGFMILIFMLMLFLLANAISSASTLITISPVLFTSLVLRYLLLVNAGLRLSAPVSLIWMFIRLIGPGCNSPGPFCFCALYHRFYAVG